MGMNPSTAGSADEPWNWTNPDHTLSYVFTRNLATEGIQSWFEASTDFQDWTRIEPIQLNFIEELQDGLHKVEAIFPVDGPELFLRYRVSEGF